jgi:putative transposase
MAEITRLSGGSDCMELDVMEREATPEPADETRYSLHLEGLSLSNTVSELERFGVDRSRSTVHNWMQKTGLQPDEDRCPDHVALDETVIQLDDQ